ncbi:hypothetical protein GCM10009347_28020 [Shewanella algicola]|uniref:CopL family metal-binding regulatory protein n=1 Tax=Shewanella algicola TaxID=640633 RepID=A0A9X1ZAB4_9GAMM|nr:hypothetical protein [Shewanella algicola]MCL1106577.1 hypothetical protein [Shewanella algicola]GGP60048.1 hypothetical protein GCM10009347_28020 [Shewanella algicola]
MRKSIRHYLIAICTLLSLLGQGVLANGYTMIAPNDMPMPHHTTNTSTTSNMQNGTDCHSMMMQEHDIQESHCCDNAGACGSDCSHCFTISFTGTVFSTDMSVSPAPVESAIILPIEELISIDGTPAFRPPIV